MTCTEVKDVLSVILDDIECKEVAPGHTVVSSPFVGIDGDYPEVHILELGDGNFTLTDYGESFRALANINIDALDSSVRNEIVRRIDTLLGVIHEQGRFNLKVRKSELGSGLHRMFEALSFVSDMVFTANPRDEADFKDRVNNALLSVKAPNGDLQRNVELQGKISGRSYRVDFRLKNIADVWIESISAVTSSSFRTQVNSAHTMWSDQLMALGAKRGSGPDTVGFRSITLLDDGSLGMEVESIKLLNTVSHVELWSNLDHFKHEASRLTAAYHN